MRQFSENNPYTSLQRFAKNKKTDKKIRNYNKNE